MDAVMLVLLLKMVNCCQLINLYRRCLVYVRSEKREVAALPDDNASG